MQTTNVEDSQISIDKEIRKDLEESRISDLEPKRKKCNHKEGQTNPNEVVWAIPN